jgi:hypothetical protein
MLRAQFRQYPATAAADAAGPRSCAAAAALPQAVIPPAQQPRSAARPQAGSLVPRHPTLGSVWTPHQVPRSTTRPRSRRHLAAHPDDRRHANAPQPAGRLACWTLTLHSAQDHAAAAALPQTDHHRQERYSTAPLPEPQRHALDTSRPPTCRTLGNLRRARSGCSYARGHALRHQPAETGRARTPPSRRCRIVARRTRQNLRAGLCDPHQLAPARHDLEPAGALGKLADGRGGMGCFGSNMNSAPHTVRC